jgi:hypothetical protein
MREWRWPRAGKIKFAHLPMEWQAEQEEAARKKESCTAAPAPRSLADNRAG